MAYSDPISEASPSAKKRKLNNGSQAKAWNSDEDSGDDLFEEPQTVATVPLKRTQFSSPDPLYSTQPTQSGTQFTYSSQAPVHDVQVERSSPLLQSPARPAPISRAPFSKPQSMLASVASLAPRGTILRRPVTQRPPPRDIDSDASDPPVEHSSDDDARGLVSNIRPTQFKRGGKEVGNSSPAMIQESPRAPPSVFSSLVSRFAHNEADDMASAYGSVSRAPRPQAASRPKSIVPPQLSSAAYDSIDDIEDFRTRTKVERMIGVLGSEVSITRCLDALKRKHMNFEDALSYLVDQEDRKDSNDPDIAPFQNPSRDAKDYLSGLKSLQGPARSVARPVIKTSSKQEIRAPVQSIAGRYNAPNRAQASQDVRPKPSAKHVIDVPSQSIADRYTSTQRPKRTQPAASSPDDDVIRPRGRLVRGPRDRQAHSSSPDPLEAGSPVKQHRRLTKRTVISIDEDDDGEDQTHPSDTEPEIVASTFDERVLDFFNTCSKQEMADLSAQPEDIVDIIISRRPFGTLADVGAVSKENNKPSTSKRKAKTIAIGEKILSICQELLEGFEAVDQLVDKCETLAKPVQDSLKAWGVGGQGNGELELMKIDEPHDSGIGTPSSTYSEAKRTKPKSDFLPQPSNMNTSITMKDYQLVGLNWLHLLYNARTSCILADDMGLGKTCQIISFLAQLQLEEVNGIHLVIVPASTLENWLRELNNFAPSLSVFAYHGSQSYRLDLQEKLQDELDAYDVIVTTYEMAVADNKFLRQIDPIVCVYDEAHQLRNPKSNRYNRLMRIPAEFKVLLTGTPLQNNLQELVAILAFIMPDLFTEKREVLDNIFKHKASTNGSHNALLAAQRTDRARSMITPFILRRKKHQVLDLPAKHSRVEYCELSDAQAEIYGEVTSEVHTIFEDRAAGVKNAKLSTNILMRLRKAAIHPLLQRRVYDDKMIDKITNQLLKNDEFAGNPRDRVIKYLTGEAAQSLNGTDFALHRFCAERDYLERYALQNEEWMDSGKVEMLKKLLQGFVKNGDRCLVFSQFTMVMDILEAVLQTLDIKFMRLDGSTKVEIRQTMIDAFNTEDDIAVFMLSTKAGGAGINLASANKVIIFDSGFNPQDDIQAENRAHRVGQTREVEVIRLVSKDTIEEQIHALGVSKLALDDKVAGEGATAAEDKAAEKAGADAVERMLMEKMQTKQEATSDIKTEQADAEDVKDAFKKGLQGEGLQVE